MPPSPPPRTKTQLLKMFPISPKLWVQSKTETCRRPKSRRRIWAFGRRQNLVRIRRKSKNFGRTFWTKNVESKVFPSRRPKFQFFAPKSSTVRRRRRRWHRRRKMRKCSNQFVPKSSNVRTRQQRVSNAYHHLLNEVNFLTFEQKVRPERKTFFDRSTAT